MAYFTATSWIDNQWLDLYSTTSDGLESTIFDSLSNIDILSVDRGTNTYIRASLFGGGDLVLEGQNFNSEYFENIKVTKIIIDKGNSLYVEVLGDISIEGNLGVTGRIDYTNFRTPDLSVEESGVTHINYDGDIAANLTQQIIQSNTNGARFVFDGDGVGNWIKVTVTQGQELFSATGNWDISEFVDIDSSSQYEVLLSGDDTFSGSSYDDSFSGLKGNDIIYGRDGIDTAIYSGNRADFTLNITNNVTTITDLVGTEGVDTLNHVERVQFADSGIAIDLNGNAGTTAKVLGVTFGAESISNAKFVGIGLSLLGRGMDYETLMGRAITAAGAKTNEAVVDLLWGNLFGVLPTDNEAARYIALLDDGKHTPESLGVRAAELDLNTTNIDLVGLAQTGIEFV